MNVCARFGVILFLVILQQGYGSIVVDIGPDKKLIREDNPAIMTGVTEQWNFPQMFADVVAECPGENQDLLPNPDKVEVEDLKGSLNNVLKISDGSKTVTMKHAPPYLASLGPDWPMTPQRAAREYASLCKYAEVMPGSVPQPYCYSEKLNTVLFEYLSGYEDMQKQLVRGEVDKPGCDQLARTLARLHAATHKNKLSEQDFTKLKEEFSNPGMCELTERFTFMTPFDVEDGTNRVQPKVKDAAEKRIYNNQVLLNAVREMKTKYQNEKESLVHGYMSPRNVMLKTGEVKLVDCEFSFIGPVAYDVGTIVAHYMITYHQHMLTEQDNDAHRRVSYKMMDVINNTVTIYQEELSSLVPNLPDDFSVNFVKDVAGFAGCEILRRVLGASHAPGIKDNEGMELEVMDTGLRLLQGRRNMDDVGRLTMIGLQLC